MSLRKLLFRKEFFFKKERISVLNHSIVKEVNVPKLSTAAFYKTHAVCPLGGAVVMGMECCVSMAPILIVWLEHSFHVVPRAVT